MLQREAWKGAQRRAGANGHRVTAAVVAAHCLAAVPYTLRRPEPDLAAAGVDVCDD